MGQVRLCFSVVHVYGQQYLIDSKQITHSFVGSLLLSVIENNKHCCLLDSESVNIIAIVRNYAVFSIKQQRINYVT